MASSSLESTHHRSRRDLRRSSRSRDTGLRHDDADYGDDEINPPPGTEIARGNQNQHSRNPPRLILLTTTIPLLHHRPTFLLTSLQLSLPLHLHISPLHFSHHHVSKHHDHGLRFLTHAPQAHRLSIHMHHDHATGSPPLAIVAHLDTMIATTIDTMIGAALTGAVLPILADVANVDIDLLQHHVPDGTPVTIAVHTLGDTILGHANGSHMKHPLLRTTTALPIVPAPTTQLTITTDHALLYPHHEPNRTLHQIHLLLRTPYSQRCPTSTGTPTKGLSGPLAQDLTVVPLSSPSRFATPGLPLVELLLLHRGLNCFPTMSRSLHGIPFGTSVV